MKKRGLLLLFYFITVSFSGLFAQELLFRNVTLEVNRQRLDHVLEILSNKADFYFSYSSSIIKKDSLVSISARNRPVKEVLQQLLSSGYEFRESGNYIIIRKAPIRMTMVTSKATIEDKVYVVSGHVYNEQSGTAISEASVYEKKLLAGALTDQDGFFKLKLKSSKATAATLTVSKEFYEDTSVVIEPNKSQQLTITLTPVEITFDRIIVSPDDYLVPDSVKTENREDSVQKIPMLSAIDSGKVERTGMGKFLLSAKQKIQTVNLRKFFTTRPFQMSFVPGLSTQGIMSGQVINNFSLNVLGGYTGGTKGVEIGGLFNIDKKDVQFFQAAGIFNVVGGETKGVQIAGVNNTALDKVQAFQAAGVNNLVKGNFSGFQLAGVYNHVTDSVKGWQAAGVANFSRRKMSGVQLAGVLNFSNKETNGVQISGVFNYSKKLKGVQFGLINIADTSEGYSIGLINIILKGYHKLSFSTNEVNDFNVAFKTGNSKFYSILMAGASPRNNDKAYSFGYGLGSELPLNKAKSFTINPELSTEYFYLGTWDYLNLLNKLHLNLNFKINKYVSLFAGPSYAVFISDQPAGVAGYRYPLPSSGYKQHSYSNRVSGWFGWNAGISFF